VAVMLDGWHQNLGEAKLQQVQRVLEMEASGQQMSAGLLQIRSIIVRLAKGRMTILMDVWRRKSINVSMKARSMLSQLTKTLKEFHLGTKILFRWWHLNQTRACIQKVRQQIRLKSVFESCLKKSIIDEQAKTEIYEALLKKVNRGLTEGVERVSTLETSHDAASRLILQLRSDQRANALESEHKVEAMKSIWESKVHYMGLSQIRNIMGRLAKGYVAVLVKRWLASSARAKQERQQRVFQVRGQVESMKSAALAQIRIVMGQLAKGQVAMLLSMWHHKIAEAKLERMQRLLEAKIHQGQMSAGLSQIRNIMGRLAKGYVASLLSHWYYNLRQFELQELATLRIRLKNSISDNLQDHMHTRFVQLGASFCEDTKVITTLRSDALTTRAESTPKEKEVKDMITSQLKVTLERRKHD